VNSATKNISIIEALLGTKIALIKAWLFSGMTPTQRQIPPEPPGYNFEQKCLI